MNNVLIKAFPSKLSTRPVRSVKTTLADDDGKHTVILHDDPHHTVRTMTKKLMKVVPDMCESEAVEITTRTYRTGQCIVRTVVANLAREYHDGLKSEKLTCTVEPPL